MSLTDLEQHILAYYAAGQAGSLNIATRWYPYGELTMIIEDKMNVATRKFGFKVTSKTKPVAKAFLDHMIEKGGWTTKQNNFGGTMHQFQTEAFRAALAEMQASDPIIQKAKEGGDAFWTDAFAALTA